MIQAHRDWRMRALVNDYCWRGALQCGEVHLLAAHIATAGPNLQHHSLRAAARLARTCKWLRERLAHRVLTLLRHFAAQHFGRIMNDEDLLHMRITPGLAD